VRGWGRGARGVRIKKGDFGLWPESLFFRVKNGRLPSAAAFRVDAQGPPKLPLRPRKAESLRAGREIWDERSATIQQTMPGSVRQSATLAHQPGTLGWCRKWCVWIGAIALRSVIVRSLRRGRIESHLSAAAFRVDAQGPPKLLLRPRKVESLRAGREIRGERLATIQQTMPGSVRQSATLAHQPGTLGWCRDRIEGGRLRGVLQSIDGRANAGASDASGRARKLNPCPP
jgi:hypothetical protein